MKKILKFTLVTVFGLIMFSSCEKAWDPIFNDPNFNATGYVQFMSAESDFVVNKLNAAGDAANATYDIDVQLLGPPASAARTINFTVSDHGVVTDDVGDTVMVPATAAMYTLSSNSFTVEAGTTHGTITVTLVNLELPLQETVYFDLKLTGEGLAESTTESTVTLFKKDFCPWVKEDLIGTYNMTYTEPWYSVVINEPWVVTAGEGDTLIFAGIWNVGVTTLWGEALLDSEPTKIVFDGSDPINPNVYIPLVKENTAQYLLTSDWGPYWVAGINDRYGITSYDWNYRYCDKQLEMHIVSCGEDLSWSGVIIHAVLDWSGAKKTVTIKRQFMEFDYGEITKYRR